MSKKRNDTYVFMSKKEKIMIQFNFNRFGKLAKWSLTSDRSYYVRGFMQVLVILTLIYLAFTTNFFKFTVNGLSNPYLSCSTITILLFFITLIIGPSLMFQSMKDKHDRQTLLMLPASNFEKYIMRYSTWIILIPLYLIAFFAADLIQYLVNVIGGNEDVMFVAAKMVDKFGDMGQKASAYPRNEMIIIYILLFWLHSAYALGATFFRSHKFSAIFTTVVIIVIGMFFTWISKYVDDDSPQAFKCMALIYGVWALVNFWLSFKLFCRTQVKGKFVNL